MPTTQNELNELLQLVPDWARVLADCQPDGTISNTNVSSLLSNQKTAVSPIFVLFQRLGPKAIYKTVCSTPAKRQQLLRLIRDHYLLILALALLPKSAILRRFFQERRIDRESQQAHITSISAELASKLAEALRKKIDEQVEDGFKVLLPAYVQTSSNNAVIDFIKLESQWERQTLHDLNLDSDQEDPRDNVAAESTYIPENIVLSKEKVKYLNDFRQTLQVLFAEEKAAADQSLLALDCMFGLGLSPYSQLGVEMTMKECCQKLSIAGETQARQIARCQVLLDKAMSSVRQLIREELPTVAAYRQQQININNASRRDLRHQLELTEGEIERLLLHRQYDNLEQLLAKSVVKRERLEDIATKGAVAVPVPVDLNSATTRDLIDILALSKTTAQRLASSRPFANLGALTESANLSEAEVKRIFANGAVLRAPRAPDKTNINVAELAQLTGVGLKTDLCERILCGRPYKSWQELEDYLSCEASCWQLLRKNFVLSEASS